MPTLRSTLMGLTSVTQSPTRALTTTSSAWLCARPSAAGFARRPARQAQPRPSLCTDLPTLQHLCLMT
eukprot:2955763-Rhodomonas_salina.1